jgi:hypothetical protein
VPTISYAAVQDIVEKAHLQQVRVSKDLRLQAPAIEREKLEAIPPELQLSFRRMTPEQRTGLKRKVFLNALIESRRLPRLSLFYWQDE